MLPMQTAQLRTSNGCYACKALRSKKKAKHEIDPPAPGRGGRLVALIVVFFFLYTGAEIAFGVDLLLRGGAWAG
jgi:hypothetical protein